MTEHLDDLDADFRALYRIDGIGDEEFGTLSGPRFLALAERTFCYEGTMAALAAREHTPSPGSTPPVPGRRPDHKEVPATKAAITASPELADLIDFC